MPGRLCLKLFLTCAFVLLLEGAAFSSGFSARPSVLAPSKGQDFPLALKDFFEALPEAGAPAMRAGSRPWLSWSFGNPLSIRPSPKFFARASGPAGSKNSAGSAAAKAGGVSDAVAEKWIRSLRQDRKKLNAKNFPYILDGRVCGYLQKLKEAEKQKKGRPPLSAIKKKDFFKEVLRIYGKALDHTLDHNHFYCLYHYFGSPRHPKILELGGAFLSAEKREKLLGRLEVCHGVEIEGNGDDPNNPGGSSRMRELYKSQKESEKKQPGKSGKDAAADPPPLKLLPPAVYGKMPYKLQKRYSNSARRAFLELEKDSEKKSPAARQAQAAPLPAFLLWPFFASAAEAGLARPARCLIGGALRKTVYQDQTGRYVCPTRDNPCEGQKDGFKCGLVFNEKCVSRNPVKSLSKRCYEAAREEPVSHEKYRQFSDSLRGDFDAYCRDHARGAACQLYALRINQAEEYFSKKAETAEAERQTQITERTEAQAACLDCLEAAPSPDKTAEILKSIASFDQIERTEMTDYLSDSVFEISACKCEPGNDRCTRGCGKPGSPPLLDCKGDKPQGKSWKKCMRHVLSSMMKTIHEFMGKHCPNYPFDYGACDKGGGAGAKSPICDQGFVMPSALCALNLDGKDRYSLIEDTEPIKDRRGRPAVTKPVSKSCEEWKSHNKSLTEVVILDDEGQPKKIPLFQKIDMPEDPEDLPDGSIVVMSSRSPHGHVEIKTNKNKCGDGEDVCFCSDYCASRKGGYKPPFKPLAAFQWNPEALKYFEENM